MSPSLVEIWAAEADRAIQRTAERLAQDPYRSDPVMKIYSEGADNAEPTWIGKCTKCGRRYVTNLSPATQVMPDDCEGSSPANPHWRCCGEVRLDPESEALLAVFLLHGYDAIQDGPRAREVKVTVVGLDEWLPLGAAR